VKRISEKIKLQEQEVEKKLSQMILDNKFQGILDQVNFPATDLSNLEFLYVMQYFFISELNFLKLSVDTLLDSI
jgi:hypothetical protein